MSTQQSSDTARATATYAIVVGVDFETPGDNALREALRLAIGRGDVAFHVVHAIPDAADGSRRTRAIDRKAALLAEVPARLNAHVQAVAREVPGSEAVLARIHTRIGPPADAILQLAVDVGAELIVVGTHGRRGVRKLLLGSVAEQLIQAGRCPILVAHPRDFSGLAHSDTVEPLCDDCAAARAASDGKQLWCEFHARPHIRPHGYSSSQLFNVGGHDPAIVPSGA